MPVFAIISQPGPNTAKLEAAVMQAFPQTHVKLDENVWLVAGSSSTAKDVCDRVGISKGTGGNGVVLQLNGDYFGLANAPIWAWLKNSFEASNGA
jgi:hypothetical protein